MKNVIEAIKSLWNFFSAIFNKKEEEVKKSRKEEVSEYTLAQMKELWQKEHYPKITEAGTFSDCTTPTIPYRYWKEDGTKEYANVTLAELKQAGIVSSQQQNAAYTKFEPILNTIRNATSKAEVEPYLPPEEETETEEVQ